MTKFQLHVVINRYVPATSVEVTTLLGRDALVVATVGAHVSAVLHLGARESVLDAGVDAGIVAGRGLASSGLGLVAVEVALGLLGNVAKVLLVVSGCHFEVV
jgi:hypothetical protein